MKKIKYLFFVLLSIFFFSCGKGNKKSVSVDISSDTTEQSETNNKKKEVNIEKALFINPEYMKMEKKDTEIMDALIYYLDHTPRGAIVHISIYLFSNDLVVQAVKNAFKRGVIIKLLITKPDNPESTTGRAISELQSFIGDPSKVMLVNNDITSDAIDHEKYVLFSEVELAPDKKAKHLVFATSSNFTINATKRIQDAIVMTNKDLYGIFLANWDEINKWHIAGMKNFSYIKDNVGDSITVFFSPRRKNGEWDGEYTIPNQLDKLDKSGYSNDTVRVLMATWSAGRYGLKIADKLINLQKKGVTVEVIVSKESTSDKTLSKLEYLENKGGEVKYLENKIFNNHSKTMLIKGKWNGREQQIILTGSHNYTNNSLWNHNEFLLMLKNSVLFNDYWKNWRNVKRTLPGG